MGRNIMSKKIGMIPAAGRGSRMLSLTDNHPKPMLPFNNKPIIGHLLEWFIKEEFDEVIVIVEYKYDKIIDCKNFPYLFHCLNGVLFNIDRPKVTSSVYSNSSPTEIPRAITLSLTSYCASFRDM